MAKTGMPLRKLPKSRKYVHVVAGGMSAKNKAKAKQLAPKRKKATAKRKY